MVPRSFYAGPLLPNGSFHLGICNNALLWRSDSPYTSVPDHLVYFNQGASQSALQMSGGACPPYWLHLLALMCEARMGSTGGVYLPLL